MKAERCAAVYARKGDYLVETNSQTVNGLWLSAAPVFRLPQSASDRELGSAISEALAESRVGVPHPTNWLTFPYPILQVAGVQSWNAIQRFAALCQVEASNAGFRILPTLNGGLRGVGQGYHALLDMALSVPAGSTDDDLGIAIVSAFAACQ